MNGLIISVSNLRGVIGTSLTPDAAARYVTAFAKQRHGVKQDKSSRPRVFGRRGWQFIPQWCWLRPYPRQST